VAIIHGIGRQDKSYANEFIKLIKKHYQKLSGNAELVFESICWQEQIEPLEEDLFSKVGHLGWAPLRSFFIGYVGDALCYQPSSNDSHGFYTTIHEAIDKGLVALAKKVDKDSPLCIISHSLGTIVTSNFIWDVQNGCNTFNPSKEAISLVDRLELLYTMASPLAVWSMRFPDGGTPIQLKNVAYWYNLYTHNDIIASPIKLINQQYDCMSNLFDIKVSIGNWLIKWNPMSHNAYWDSNLVTKHIASNLHRIQKFYSSWEEANAKS
jgi:hypothetical protein